MYEGENIMEKSKFCQRKWRSLLFAAVFLAIGIGLCFVMQLGTERLSVFVGIILLFIGVLNIVRSLILEKAVLTAEGVKGAIVIVFGLAFMFKDIVTIVADLIPYFLFAIGCEVLAEAFLKKFAMKQEGLLRFILQLVVGAALVALSICIRYTAFGEYTFIVMGVLFIVMAVFITFSSFIQLKGMGSDEKGTKNSEAAAVAAAVAKVEAQNAPKGQNEPKAQNETKEQNEPKEQSAPEAQKEEKEQK
jgi:glucan phosphoethanolaminetransferase (alkaline phosphatase superfamily)